ncbi:MAG: Gfo/Idh/MocA family oxidoreductase [Lentisphaerae bacterium]|nr:Gfo/Idh/MocA family oxidoreductase [Lentisphaerota bacterium]
MKKIGFIGLDTSHVVAFTELLNDPRHPWHVAGGRVTTAWPGGSPDFPKSIERVPGFTAALRDKHDVTIVDSPEAVAEACDLVFIESVDGRVHLDQFKRTLPYGKPTFIDKPFALRVDEAREMVRLADAAGIALMSGSSLRYADQLQQALAKGRDDIRGCNVFGPMQEEPTQPGLFWYGCHAIEMMVAAMGAGCGEVRCLRNASHDLLTAVWKDGRMAGYHGLRDAHGRFGLVLHRKGSVEYVDAQAGRPYSAGLVAALLANLPQNRAGVPAEELIEVVGIIAAANRSRANRGEPVALAT